MQICKDHWEAMIQAVKDRDLYKFVARSGEEAVAAAIRELQDGEVAPTDWDPLMQMNWNFISKAIEFGGLYLLGVKDDGSQYCPLCEAAATSSAEEIQKWWIDGCADAMLTYARSLGLVPKVQ